MSSSPPSPRGDVIEKLMRELKERLAGRAIRDVSVGPLEQQDGRLVLSITLEEAADEASVSSFEEDLEYVLEKNHELYKRLS